VCVLKRKYVEEKRNVSIDSMKSDQIRLLLPKIGSSNAISVSCVCVSVCV